MNTRPKRRKHKDNPYSLEYITITNNYYVSFKDGINQEHKVSISKELFDAFNQFELNDLKELNEFDRHIEHNEVTECTLVKRIKNAPESIELAVEKKLGEEILYLAIEQLPIIQKRRLKMHYFDHMTLREIAKVEGCNYTAVKFSIDSAIKNLRKKLKNTNLD